MTQPLNRTVVRYGNGDNEHLGFQKTDLKWNDGTLCGAGGAQTVVETVDRGVVSTRARLPICPDCVEILHDLLYLAGDPYQPPPF